MPIADRAISMDMAEPSFVAHHIIKRMRPNNAKAIATEEMPPERMKLLRIFRQLSATIPPQSYRNPALIRYAFWRIGAKKQRGL